MSLLVKNGQLVDVTALELREVDIFIQGGVISGINVAPKGFKAKQTLDAGGRWVMPGIIDCQARLRDPGQPEKANIESETEAAIKNGITTLCVPPDN